MPFLEAIQRARTVLARAAMIGFMLRLKDVLAPIVGELRAHFDGHQRKEALVPICKPTCHSIDGTVRRMRTDASIRVGDWLLYKDMGVSIKSLARVWC